MKVKANTKHSMAPLLALLVGVMLVLPAGTALAAKEKGKPTFTEEKGHGGEGQGQDKWALSNDQISIWFHEKKPMLKVFRTGEDGNKSGYMLKIQEIFETDSEGGRKASINLEKSRPQDWIVEERNETEGIAVSLSANLPQQGIYSGVGDITLVFHVNATSAEVKFDLIIGYWAWTSANPENAALNLKMLVVGETATKSADNRAEIGNKGHVKWESGAECTYGDGTNGALSVEAQVGQGTTNGSASASASHIILKFNGTGNYTALSYDPTLGVIGTNWNLIIGMVVLASAGIAAVAIYALNRKKRQ